MVRETVAAFGRLDAAYSIAGVQKILAESADAARENSDRVVGINLADAVLECVGTQESMLQAIRSTRQGGYVRCVGVPHGVELNGEELFFAHVHLHDGGPAPMRRFLPELKILDLVLPLNQVAQGYRAMDERRSTKTLLRPRTTHAR